MKQELTDKQQKVVEFLFGEAMGNVKLAMKLAGYSHSNTSVFLTTGVKDAIIEQAKTYLALHAPKAALAMVGVIDDPTTLGVQHKLKAAAEILDRNNIVKTDKVEVETSSGIFLLPGKDKVNEDDSLPST